MDTELFTFDGNRKYLTADEQENFIAAANDHERAEVRTLCLTLAYTGCRISEALALTADRVDLSDKTITFQTLKQRDKVKFRACLLYTSPSPRDQRGARMPSSA